MGNLVIARIAGIENQGQDHVSGNSRTAGNLLIQALRNAGLERVYRGRSGALRDYNNNVDTAVIRIITIEREYGCGAAEIAAALAARLGWKLWDQLLTQEIARLARCKQSAVEEREERRDPLYHRLLKSFALGSYEGNLGVYPVETLDADSIFKISKRVVEEAAASGNCVIVGRGSQHFLQDRTDTLRFFLYAPRGAKVQRLISEGHKQSEANMLVDTVDQERADFIKTYFHAKWPNRPVYHAMLNTGVGEETVVEAMLTFLRQTQEQAATTRLPRTADSA